MRLIAIKEFKYGQPFTLKMAKGKKNTTGKLQNQDLK